MNIPNRRAVPFVLIASAACGSSSETELASFAERSSYAIGMDIGTTVARTGADIDLPALMQGITDILEEREALLSDDEVREVLTQFAQQVQEQQATERQEMLARNTEDGAAYREENGARSGVTTTASGLQYEVMEAGNGPRPTPDDRVTVHYRGTLIDGTEFDTSYGGDPVTFAVTGVITGWTEGLQLMQVGGKYRLVVPPELAYGPAGSGPNIEPNSTLVFEVELVAIAP